MELLSSVKLNLKIISALIVTLHSHFSYADSVKVVSRDDAIAAYAISMIELAFSKIIDPYYPYVCIALAVLLFKAKLKDYLLKRQMATASA